MLCCGIKYLNPPPFDSGNTVMVLVMVHTGVTLYLLLLGKGLGSSCAREDQAHLSGWVAISLWDIRSMPTRSVFTFFQTFLNFWRTAPKCRHLGGGMCMLFEICGKTPFQKCMGWGG